MPHRPSPIPRFNSNSNQINIQNGSAVDITGSGNGGFAVAGGIGASAQTVIPSHSRRERDIPPRHRSSSVVHEGHPPKDRSGGGHGRTLPPPRFQRKQRPPRVQQASVQHAALSAPISGPVTAGETLAFGPVNNWGAGTRSIASLSMAAINAASARASVVPRHNPAHPALSDDGLGSLPMERAYAQSAMYPEGPEPRQLTFGMGRSGEYTLMENGEEADIYMPNQPSPPPFTIPLPHTLRMSSSHQELRTMPSSYGMQEAPPFALSNASGLIPDGAFRLQQTSSSQTGLRSAMKKTTSTPNLLSLHTAGRTSPYSRPDKPLPSLPTPTPLTSRVTFFDDVEVFDRYAYEGEDEYPPEQPSNAQTGRTSDLSHTTIEEEEDESESDAEYESCQSDNGRDGDEGEGQDSGEGEHGHVDVFVSQALALEQNEKVSSKTLDPETTPTTPTLAETAVKVAMSAFDSNSTVNDDLLLQRKLTDTSDPPAGSGGTDVNPVQQIARAQHLNMSPSASPQPPRPSSELSHAFNKPLAPQYPRLGRPVSASFSAGQAPPLSHVATADVHRRLHPGQPRDRHLLVPRDTRVRSNSVLEGPVFMRRQEDILARTSTETISARASQGASSPNEPPPFARGQLPPLPSMGASFLPAPETLGGRSRTPSFSRSRSPASSDHHHGSSDLNHNPLLSPLGATFVPNGAGSRSSFASQTSSLPSLSHSSETGASSSGCGYLNAIGVWEGAKAVGAGSRSLRSVESSKSLRSTENYGSLQPTNPIFGETIWTVGKEEDVVSISSGNSGFSGGLSSGSASQWTRNSLGSRTLPSMVSTNAAGLGSLAKQSKNDLGFDTTRSESAIEKYRGGVRGRLGSGRGLALPGPVLETLEPLNTLEATPRMSGTGTPRSGYGRRDYDLARNHSAGSDLQHPPSPRHRPATITPKASANMSAYAAPFTHVHENVAPRETRLSRQSSLNERRLTSSVSTPNLSIVGSTRHPNTMPSSYRHYPSANSSVFDFTPTPRPGRNMVALPATGGVFPRYSEVPNLGTTLVEERPPSSGNGSGMRGLLKAVLR